MLVGVDESDSEDDINFFLPKQVLLIFDDKKNDDSDVNDASTANEGKKITWKEYKKMNM